MCSTCSTGSGLMNSFRTGFRIRRISRSACPTQSARRRVHQLAVEGVQRRPRLVLEEERRRLVLPLEVDEQIGADGARIEEAIELHARELPDLRLGVIGAALVADPRPDLAHDLLDVDVIGSNGELWHGTREPSRLTLPPAGRRAGLRRRGSTRDGR